MRHGAAMLTRIGLAAAAWVLLSLPLGVIVGHLLHRMMR